MDDGDRLTSKLVTLVQFENSLRRHNHIGLVHALLVGLAEAGQLSPVTQNARKVMGERVARQREAGLGDHMDDD